MGVSGIHLDFSMKPIRSHRFSDSSDSTAMFQSTSLIHRNTFTGDAGGIGLYHLIYMGKSDPPYRL